MLLATIASSLAGEAWSQGPAKHDVFHTSVEGLALPDVRAAGNYWYRKTNSDTVIVFIHGVNSNARDTWMYRNQARSDSMYWPALVASDIAFRGAAIYVAGYPSEDQDVDENPELAADSIIRALSSAALGTRAVLQRKHILFVTHSLGGIVMRALLRDIERSQPNNDLAMLLFASPTDGAGVASLGRAFRSLYNLGPAAENFLRFLEPKTTYLEGLNTSTELEIGAPHMRWTAASVCETEGVILGVMVVSQASCAHFFAPSVMVPGMDHMALVKPTNIYHPSHQILTKFYNGPFKMFVDSSPNGARWVDIRLHSTLVGGQNMNQDDIVDSTFFAPKGDSLVSFEIDLPPVARDAAPETVVGNVAASDPTRVYSVRSVGANKMILEGRTRRVDSASAPAAEARHPIQPLTPSTAELLVVQGPKTFTDTIKVRFSVKRSWVIPNVVFGDSISRAVRLDPMHREDRIPFPAWDVKDGQTANREFIIETPTPGGVRRVHLSSAELNAMRIWSTPERERMAVAAGLYFDAMPSTAAFIPAKLIWP